jgi:alkanesulfonate monooxygenase SsuD/methylene tetrahydromethanopterin reductase-like flavin-dependent oxidoreductase (luciferase family)
VRVGLFFQAPEAPGETQAQRHAEVLGLVELADTLGFDVAWLAELHSMRRVAEHVMPRLAA